MSNVLITRRVPQVGVDLLTKAGLAPDIIENDLPVVREELLERLQKHSYEAILTTMSEKVDDEFLVAAGESLKLVANFAVGYNNINLEACKARGIKVSNTPGVLSEATADQAFALLLAAARRVVEGHKMVEAGTWKGWTPTQLLGLDVSGKTMGIIGMGRIGQAFAKRAKGFDMRLIYHNRSRDEKAEAELGAGYVNLDELLTESDFISVHTPLNDETHHLLCYEQFKKMKKTVIVINTARGPIIHEKALVKALQEKWIWAAGLDVFEFEPEVSKELLSMPNVVLAPHLGSATEGTRDAMISLAANAIIQVLKGETPSNLVLN
jgi:glyoxylate reductase